MEAIAVVIFGIWNLVAIITAAVNASNNAFIPMGIAFFVVTLILGAFIVWGAGGLMVGRRRGRAPVITWQLMQIVVALSTTNNYPIAINIGVIILSIFVIIAVLHKDSLAATSE